MRRRGFRIPAGRPRTHDAHCALAVIGCILCRESRRCSSAALPFNLALMQPRGRPTIAAALQVLRDDSEYRSLVR
ncbi:MAG TPA: hypothetical protein VL132_02970 [Planctomycetaceae bacterium]|nr:hypothetical protein [Planctomycetaceae bacterium]